jgi:anhydro-N-acetylmuramic acid kinase
LLSEIVKLRIEYLEMKNYKFRVIGAMSGTSLDGLDLAYCVFELKDKLWTYNIERTLCVHYSKSFREQLANLESKTALDFVKLDIDFGVYVGKKIKEFVSKNKFQVDFVSSHGHTIFHQPQKGITAQIGNGACIAAESGITTVCDFRKIDLAMGGQGAPLVPIGDQLLFREYDYCLNLGGIANISFQHLRERIAYDICPFNMVINNLTSEIGLEMDKNGSIAQKGKLNLPLLQSLNKIQFYKKKYPKSLGKELIMLDFLPKLKSSSLPLEDKLCTFYEHAAIQIASATNKQFLKGKGKVICTGGGAYNKYFIQRLQHYTQHEIVLPDKKIIEFKEAMVFAFLGVLRMLEKKNCLRSVTGATTDNVGGCVYFR